MDLFDIFLSKLAPHVCVGCGQEGFILCYGCRALLPDPPDRDAPYGLDSIRAATIYDSFAKDLVARLKFQGAREAAKVMALQMAPLLANAKQAVIVPVPTATSRVRQRGFDQADLIARHLSRASGIKRLKCLRRYGQTHQLGASREKRLSQLESAFKLRNEEALKDRLVILVDDVITTGATLQAAAAVIQAASPMRTEAVVFAQADLYLGDESKNSIITPVRKGDRVV